MAERLEHFFFRNYSKAIKEWLEKTVQISRYIGAEQNVQVAYMTPERAFAKYLYPVVNGNNVAPMITFMLIDSSYAEGENSLGFTNDIVHYNTSNIVRYVKPLLVFKLSYQISINTIMQSDCDVMMYQIMSNATKNRKAAVAVDGQWCEIMAGNPRNEINLEPGDAQDKLVRYGMDLTIPRAYLPRDYYENPTINSTDFDIETVTSIA
jgi:hypothetical protein